jgi:hypothetical protein
VTGETKTDKIAENIACKSFTQKYLLYNTILRKSSSEFEALVNQTKRNQFVASNTTLQK